MIKNKKLFLKIIFGILVVVILIGGFFLIKNLLIVTPPQPSTIEVTYSTRWGPLVANYEITISNEGDVMLIDNLTRIESEKTKIAKLSAKELQELKESVIKASVFKFATDYSCRINCVVDGLSRSLEFKIDGKTKKIKNYEKSLPDELETIIKKIEDLKCLHLPDKFCPKITGVFVSADKTEYEQGEGETVKIGVKNGLDKSIWFEGWQNVPAIRSCLFDEIETKIQKFEENKWNDLKLPDICCTGGVMCKIAFPNMKILKADERLEFSWDQMVWKLEENRHISYKGEIVYPGRYRIVFAYSLSDQGQDLKYAYSNEFTIKEKKEVTITTNKTEYQQGEIVKVTISKGYKPIYVEYFPMGSKILFYRQKGDGWEELIPECETNCQWICKNNKLEMGPCILYAKPEYDYYEYTSPLEIQWNQKECIYKTKPCGNQTYEEDSLKQISPGKFKVEFCYWNKEDVDLIKPQGLAPLEKKKCIDSNFMIK